jgi:hypothetical protein
MIVGSQLNAPGRQPQLLEQLRLADGGVTARWGMANDRAGLGGLRPFPDATTTPTAMEVDGVGPSARLARNRRRRW